MINTNSKNILDSFILPSKVEGHSDFTTQYINSDVQTVVDVSIVLGDTFSNQAMVELSYQLQRYVYEHVKEVSIQNINIDCSKLKHMSCFIVGSFITLNQVIKPSNITLTNLTSAARKTLEYLDFIEFCNQGISNIKVTP